MEVLSKAALLKLLFMISRTSESGFSVSRILVFVGLNTLIIFPAIIAQLPSSDPRWGVPKKAIA